MRIIFVRHGETVFNKEKKYQGHTDAVLSDLGRQQAVLLANHLADARIAAVYSSDLSRAYDTACEIAARHGIEVIADPNLRECFLGDWQGLSVSEIPKLFPEEYRKYAEDPVKNRPPNAERLEEMQKRIVETVDRIKSAHQPSETVVIAAHGGPIRSFICHALESPLSAFRKIRLDNAGITTLRNESDGRWSIESLNDTCHLKRNVDTTG